MKFALFLVGLAAFVNAQAPAATPAGTKEFVRDLPADILRDFPDLCFAYTRCMVFQVGQKWELNPFCGISTCVRSPTGGLLERVQDCGPLPKANPKCKITNEAARNETFPVCCPQFQCEAGVKLEYPTPEEIAAEAKKALEAQKAAAAKAASAEAAAATAAASKKTS